MEIASRAANCNLSRPNPSLAVRFGDLHEISSIFAASGSKHAKILAARRVEIGVRRHIGGRYLAAYASKTAWCGDNRRRSNGAPHPMAAESALRHPVSRQWKRDRRGGRSRLSSTLALPIP